MHLLPVSVSRRWFLASLVLCALMLLLIPTLQTQPRQGKPPRPLPKGRSPRVENDTTHKEASVFELPLLDAKSHEVQVNSSHFGLSGSQSREALDLIDIFIAVKTTRKYHKSRLNLLFQTWVSEAREQVWNTVSVSYNYVYLCTV